MELFAELIKIGGLAFALAVVALIALLRGDVVTKKSYEFMCLEKDRQIKREQDRVAELWALVLPSIQLGKKALDKVSASEAYGRD